MLEIFHVLPFSLIVKSFFFLKAYQGIIDADGGPYIVTKEVSSVTLEFCLGETACTLHVVVSLCSFQPL